MSHQPRGQHGTLRRIWGLERSGEGPSTDPQGGHDGSTAGGRPLPTGHHCGPRTAQDLSSDGAKPNQLQSLSILPTGLLASEYLSSVPLAAVLLASVTTRHRSHTFIIRTFLLCVIVKPKFIHILHFHKKDNKTNKGNKTRKASGGVHPAAPRPGPASRTADVPAGPGPASRLPGGNLPSWKGVRGQDACPEGTPMPHRDACPERVLSGGGAG